MSLETNRRRDGNLKSQEAGNVVVPCFICVAPSGREDFTKRVMMMLALEVSHIRNIETEINP